MARPASIRLMTGSRVSSGHSMSANKMRNEAKCHYKYAQTIRKHRMVVGYEVELTVQLGYCYHKLEDFHAICTAVARKAGKV